MKTPTPGDLRDFIAADTGWIADRNGKHDFFERTLPDGTVLSTHASWGKSKTVSPDIFKKILAIQLAVTEKQFWDTIRLKKSQRTTVVVAEPKKDPLTLSLRNELRRRLHYSDDQLIGLSGSQAKQLLQDFHERG